MKKIIICWFITISVSSFAQSSWNFPPTFGKDTPDTSTATLEQTINWLESKLRGISGDMESNLYGTPNTWSIQVKGTIIYRIDVGSGTAAWLNSKNTEAGINTTVSAITITKAFNLKNLTGYYISKYAVTLICDNCVEITDDNNSPLSYGAEIDIVFPLDFSTAQRFNNALKHLKNLLKTNNNENQF